MGQTGGAVRPVTAGQVVANFYTGLAIDGFDPVAYFVGDEPSTGRADLEVRSGGGIWRFRNEGNRAAFSAAPDVYMPRFGGYDPVAIGRGVATPGNPLLWAIADKRLYLFYSVEAQAAFTRDPDAAVEAAERNWSEVLRNITP